VRGKGRLLVKALAVVAGGTLGLMILGRLGYRALLYPAPRAGLDTAPVGGELGELRAADGAPVQVARFAARDGARTLVYFHGNGESIADVVPLARALHERGLGVVLVEYRGYGSSRARSPTERGLYADGEAALAALRAEGLGPERVALWGSSLGSGVAVEMAARGHASRLVLTAPFTSIPDVAARFVPRALARWIVDDVYDNLAKAQRLSLPTLIVHGDRDGIVPYPMGVTLARAIAGAELVTVEGGGHNDLFIVAPDRILEAVVRHLSDGAGR
jgi:pimeloyl-ACP methyl ester carboxylesterase